MVRIALAASVVLAGLSVAEARGGRYMSGMGGQHGYAKHPRPCPLGSVCMQGRPGVERGLMASPQR